jgi:hypothetical protein
MLGSPGGGLGYGRGHWGRSPFRQNNTIEAGAIGGPEQRSQIVRVFDAVESKEEFVLSRLGRSQQILDSQKFSFPNDRQNALMGISAGEPGELVPGFERYANTRRAAELDQPFQAIISTLPGHADMVKLPGT